MKGSTQLLLFVLSVFPIGLIAWANEWLGGTLMLIWMLVAFYLAGRGTIRWLGRQWRGGDR